MTLNLKVNGQNKSIEIEPELRLIDVIRNKLGLKGTKEGCGEGECGACSVILNGKLVDSCLIPAYQIDGSELITIEGISQNDKMHPIQKAFNDVGAVQCGFCIPGMIMASKVLLDNNPNPNEDEIRKGIEGNLCRCTGYTKIIKAVQTAANLMK